MKYSFYKLHGAGNDFIFINDLSKKIDLNEAQTQSLCDRHFGIGADGIILVRPSEKPECSAFMYYINADGSQAEMCGNGVRCFAKFLIDHDLAPKTHHRLVVDTLAGPKPISFTLGKDELVETATVDMGMPKLNPSSIPTALSTTMQTDEGEPFVGNASIDSPWGTFSFSCVSMGNPHAVCFIDSFEHLPNEVFISEIKSLMTLDLNRLGSFFESHAFFPEHTNVEFAFVEEDGISMRVFERGVGETLACGTGACAVATVAHLTKRAGKKNLIVLPGGTLHIEIDKRGHVIMTGPAVEVYEGTIDIV